MARKKTRRKKGTARGGWGGHLAGAKWLKKRRRKGGRKRSKTGTKSDHIPLKVLEKRLGRLSSLVAKRQKSRKTWA